MGMHGRCHEDRGRRFSAAAGQARVQRYGLHELPPPRPEPTQQRARAKSDFRPALPGTGCAHPFSIFNLGSCHHCTSSQRDARAPPVVECSRSETCPWWLELSSRLDPLHCLGMGPVLCSCDCGVCGLGAKLGLPSRMGWDAVFESERCLSALLLCAAVLPGAAEVAARTTSIIIKRNVGLCRASCSAGLKARNGEATLGELAKPD